MSCSFSMSVISCVFTMPFEDWTASYNWNHSRFNFVEWGSKSENMNLTIDRIQLHLIWFNINSSFCVTLYNLFLSYLKSAFLLFAHNFHYLNIPFLIIPYLILYHPILHHHRDDPLLYRSLLPPDVLCTHERIEELLESHLLDVESLEAKLSYLLVTLQNAEASVRTCQLLNIAHTMTSSTMFRLDLEP